MIFFCLFFFVFNIYSSDISDSRINITLDKNSMRTQTYLTYSFRFSKFSSFLDFYIIPSNFYKTLSSVNLIDSFRFRYYGYSTYPFRYFISQKRKIEFNSSGSKSDYEETKDNRSKNRLKLSLNPIFDDIKENINWYLFDLTVKNLSQDWKKLDGKQKKEFLRDLSLINIPFINEVELERTTNTKNR